MWERIVTSPVIDVLDIVIVAWLLYRLIVFIKDTRVIQMFVGLGLLLVLSFVAETLGMMVVGRIIDSLQTVWVVAFIIIFQPELRAALTTIGLGRGLGFGRAREIPAEEELLKAVTRLSRRGLGALIVIEREVGLKNYVETGTPIEGRITHELLTTLFTPPSPLHDGAAVISGNRLVAAGCILPLSQNPRLIYALGTRHRAALGVSEETDAVVVVVSEESGAISIAERGRLLRNLDPGTLRSTLSTFFRLRPSAEEAAAAATPGVESEVVPADSPGKERVQV